MFQQTRRTLLVIAVAIMILAFLTGGMGFAHAQSPGSTPTAIPTYPPAGEDIMDSTASITVQLPIGEVQVNPDGPIVVHRSDPGDLDGDGLTDIETEMVSMDLTGKVGGTGPEIHVSVDPKRPSMGMVEEEQSGEYFPADSYFDIFIVVDTPWGRLVNDEPIRMAAVLWSIPPNAFGTAIGDHISVYMPVAEKLYSLYDESGVEVGQIVHASHEPNPPPVPTPHLPTFTPDPSSVGGGGLSVGLSIPIDAISASISPKGGNLQSVDGRVTISFPPGSVSTPVKVIYAPQPDAPISSHFTVLKAFAVSAYEEGSLQKTFDFNQPVEVQITYTDADVRFTNEEELSLYYFNTELNEWIPIESAVNTVQNTLAAQVKNFGMVGSLYAIMAPMSPTISPSSITGRLIALTIIVLALPVAIGIRLVCRRSRQRKTTSNT